MQSYRLDAWLYKCRPTYVYARWVLGDELDIKFADFGAATIRENSVI